MRQWCVPAATPARTEPLPGRLSVSPPPPDARMECCVEVEPRYTIEQIDLLQRLRLSGMTKPQILHALESLERLDPDHHHRPPSHCDSQPATSNNSNAPAVTAAVPASSSSSSSSSSSLVGPTGGPSGLPTDQREKGAKAR